MTSHGNILDILLITSSIVDEKVMTSI